MKSAALPTDSDLARKRRLVSRALTLCRESADLAVWALGARVIDGRPFSFRGHEYLHEIYRDPAAHMVIRKAAQTGATEYGMSRALHFAVTRRGRTIYYFPTLDAVLRFSADRFNPAIKGSEYLRSLVRDIDNAGLKQIGLGSIYFLGAKSRVQLKSVPADFLVLDELDEMAPKSVELASKRLGHSEWGAILKLSTPTLPLYGIDQAFEASDQRHWLLGCPACGKDLCLEDAFREHHASPYDPRREIVFVKGAPGHETLVCLACGHPLDPASGRWAAKHPGRPVHGYHLSKFFLPLVSRAEKEQGSETKPSALLRLWRETAVPAEFYNSELGLPYLAAEGGLTEEDLLAIAGKWGMPPQGKECVMGVDQGNGLHLVIKEPHEDKGMVLTVRVQHEPQADATFSHLDYFMETYDVRYCVIDALPNTHAAREFARRHRGRVFLAYYTGQKGRAIWSYDAEGTPTVSIDRTESLDAWRDAHKLRKRRIPRVEDEVGQFVQQMTNILRAVEEDEKTGEKRAVWRKRGPDHYAHADNYAEIALGRLHAGEVRASIIG